MSRVLVLSLMALAISWVIVSAGVWMIYPPAGVIVFGGGITVAVLTLIDDADEGIGDDA